MTIPDNVVRLDWVKYDSQTTEDTYKKYLDVNLCSLSEFLSNQKGLNSDDTNVENMTISLNGESHDILIYNDKFPQFYTTIGDSTLIFDSYHADYDTTLQKAKTLCHGIIYPTFTMSDNFAFDLDPSQFSLLVNRCKVRAFTELKQVGNQEAAGEARRQSVKVQKFKRKAEQLPELTRAPKYGRK